MPHIPTRPALKVTGFTVDTPAEYVPASGTYGAVQIPVHTGEVAVTITARDPDVVIRAVVPPGDDQPDNPQAAAGWLAFCRAMAVGQEPGCEVWVWDGKAGRFVRQD